MHESGVFICRLILLLNAIKVVLCLRVGLLVVLAQQASARSIGVFQRKFTSRLGIVSISMRLYKLLPQPEKGAALDTPSTVVQCSQCGSKAKTLHYMEKLCDVCLSLKKVKDW